MIITVGGLDFETTGLLTPEHRIIEACLIKYKVDTAQPELNSVTNVFTQRIDPQRTITPKSMEVHGITPADVVGCPTWEVVGPVLSDHCNDCEIVVAHNGMGFDFPFLIQELDRIGHDLPEFEPFDTMTEGRWATPFGEVPSLQKLCFTCGVDYNPDDAHAAQYDVEKMMDCFFWGLQHGHYRIGVEEKA
ncbi:MAG: 3'-5' exonuclease [Hyphomonas sp.]|nr:3'-5' exonuclease [Hyphomonas sp.]